MNIRSFLSIVTVLIGSALEYYDYMLFTLMIPIIAPIFIGEAGASGLQAGYLITFLGAICRPVGGILIGWIGDKKGRSVALFWSMIIMAASSFAIAYLPTYAQIGIWASYLLLIVRIFQTMSAAGELNGAAIFLIESFEGEFTKSRKGFASGLSWSFTVCGMLAASVAACQTNLTNWKIPFILGGGIGLFALLLRLVPKTVNEEVLTNISENFSFKKSLAASILISCGISGMFYYNMIFMPQILQLVLGKDLVKMYTVYYFIFYAVMLLISGVIFDYVKKSYYISLIGCFGMILCAFPTVYLQNLHFNFLNIVFLALFIGPSHAVLFQLFPRQFRYRYVSTAYSLGTSVIGGITPYLCKRLYDVDPIFTAVWLIFVATLGIVGIYMGKNDLVHN